LRENREVSAIRNSGLDPLASSQVGRLLRSSLPQKPTDKTWIAGRMDHQRHDDLAGVVSVVKRIRKRLKQHPPEILVNLAVNLALALNLGEMRIETGNEPITQALAALLIVIFGSARHIVENVRKKNQPVHRRCFPIFS